MGTQLQCRQSCPTSPRRAAFSTRAVIDSSVTLCRLSSCEKALDTCRVRRWMEECKSTSAAMVCGCNSA